ncbi:MAG: hypothetical protein ACM3OC_01460 [Deltaproteobacteria bacterium]
MSVRSLLFSLPLFLILSGCVTSGRMACHDGGSWKGPKVASVEIHASDSPEKWQGPEPEMAGLIAARLSGKLRDAGFTVKAKGADVSLTIVDIYLNQGMGKTLIKSISVAGRHANEPLFLVTFRQHAEILTVRSVVNPSMNEHQVAAALAGEITRKLNSLPMNSQPQKVKSGQ